MRRRWSRSSARRKVFDVMEASRPSPIRRRFRPRDLLTFLHHDNVPWSDRKAVPFAEISAFEDVDRRGMWISNVLLLAAIVQIVVQGPAGSVDAVFGHDGSRQTLVKVLDANPFEPGPFVAL
jgi:hypothetical protein